MKFWPYVWLVFKSGLWWRVWYFYIYYILTSLTHTYQSWSIFRVKYKLYNVILRIARNLLETNQGRVIIKSSTCWPKNFDWFSWGWHRGMNTIGENWLLWKGPTVCRFICVLCHHFWTNYDLDRFSTSKYKRILFSHLLVFNLCGMKQKKSLVSS